MTIATVDSSGRPSARVVLLKEFSKEKGFVFFTNYEGRKAQEIANNNNVALVFYWADIHKQIRIEGKATKVPLTESEDYFKSRSKASQAGSAASPQSKIVESREWLWKRNEEFLEKDSIPMPNWGGYSVDPDWIEFWQGQSNRLHDRVVFSKRGFEEDSAFIKTLSDGWQKARLAP
ncbi:Oidioi.mRNA.OKI2018_I69.XSR.g15892.t1.cds [Oikopleura dioica]|uniref:pyridoxal 5'-phosphate synthase n=1 Tax=Oikopleura dioica TaxID=34765 RepID=A0ABN7SIB0_OIKDI|nr:Oidioi.mRNA.OKI2018_I69.XSR.g15892.t1.cds [Oikopleura dioica]